MDKSKASEKRASKKEAHLLRPRNGRVEKKFELSKSRPESSPNGSETRIRKNNQTTIPEVMQPVWAYLYALVLPVLDWWKSTRQNGREAVLRLRQVTKRQAKEVKTRKARLEWQARELAWKALFVILIPVILGRDLITSLVKRVASSRAVRATVGSLNALYRLFVLVPTLSYRKLDSLTDWFEARLLQLFAVLSYLSTELRIRSEGVSQRLPIRQIKRNGDIVSDELRTFVLLDLSGLDENEIRKVVSDLSKLDPGYPFKLIWEGAISGSKISEHVNWLLQESEANRHKYKELSPNAELDFDKWRNWYLEVAELIKRGHRSVTPLLVVPKQALNADLKYLQNRKVRPLEISSFFLGMLDTLTEWDDKPFRESQEKASSSGVYESATPDTIDFRHDPISVKTRNIWYGDEEVRESYLSTFQIYDLPNLQELRNLLMPLINREERHFYISLSARSVPAGFRSKFLSVASKHARRLTGLGRDEASRAYDLQQQGNSSQRAYKEALGSVQKARYLSKTDHNFGEVREALVHNRPFFQTSPLTLVVKSDNEDDAREFREEVRTLLNDNGIWFTRVLKGRWYEQELHLQNILPCITNREVKDENLIVPVWDRVFEDCLFFEDIHIPQDGIVCGIVGNEGAPLSFGLNIIEAQGKPSSGKSMAAKVLAAFVRLPNPERRVIVIDNAVASASGSKSKKQSVKDAHLKGWIQWCRLMGGSVIFAEDYETPEKLVTALEEVEDERFIVYYPGRTSKQHDLEALEWLIGAMTRFHRPEKYSETEIQQMVVFDDILSWNNDKDTPQNPGHRMNYLTQDVLNQCISTGTIAFTTVQTAKAIEHGDPSSHEVVITNTDVWLNFVTSAHTGVPEAIGMRGYTPEQEALIERTASGLASITQGGTENENPGACMVTYRNVKAEQGLILVHDKMLEILSRKVVKK